MADFVNSWLKYFEQWGAYLGWCVEQPVHAPACRPFWTWTMIGLFAVGALTALVVAWRLFSYRRKLAAALRAQAERERVDQDAIEARKWNGDKAYSAELEAEEVERRIREAVNRRHLEKAGKQDGFNIV